MGYDFQSDERYQSDHTGRPVIEAKDKRIAKLEYALRDLRDVILSADNVLRGIGVREALDRAEKLLSN